MDRMLGTPDAIAMETADSYRGVTRFQDSNKKSERRAAENFKKTELKKIIQQEGVEFAKRKGWVKE